MTQPSTIKRTLLALIAVCAIYFANPSFAQTGSPSVAKLTDASKQTKTKYEPWVVSYREAVKKSKASNRPIMLVFSGSDWCGSCIRLSKEVFVTHEFAEWSAERVVKVEVDFPRGYLLDESIRVQNEQLKEKYKDLIVTYPTIIFVDAEGKLIAKTGYDGKGSQNFVDKACMLIPPKQHPRDLIARESFRPEVNIPPDAKRSITQLVSANHKITGK